MDKIMKKYESILNILKRIEGFDAFLEWLNNSTNFVEDPASTRFHGSHQGGLLEHSLKVTENLVKLAVTHDIHWDRPESPYIIGLFHDLCKTNFYKPVIKKMKNTAGEWVDVTTYEIDDKFPYGHGEKSVYLLQKYFQITDQEAMCIRFHMGAFGDQDYRYNYSNSCNLYPEIMITAMADQMDSVAETRKEKGLDNKNYTRLFNLAIDIESEEK